MKPTLTHMSRSEMQRILRNKEVPRNAAIISINDTYEEKYEIQELFWNHGGNRFVPLFASVFKDDEGSFTEEDAEDIKYYLDTSVGRGHHIMVHCFAGISRSAAVAKWINDYLKLDIEKYNNYTQHNKHVYDTLCKVSGVYNVNNYYRGMEKRDEK